MKGGLELLRYFMMLLCIIPKLLLICMNMVRQDSEVTVYGSQTAPYFKGALMTVMYPVLRKMPPRGRSSIYIHCFTSMQEVFDNAPNILLVCPYRNLKSYRTIFLWLPLLLLSLLLLYIIILYYYYRHCLLVDTKPSLLYNEIPIFVESFCVTMKRIC